VGNSLKNKLIKVGESVMPRNNLFDYATKELSQDAFICWLLTFAMKDHELEDLALASCAREILAYFTGDKSPLIVTKIDRQQKNIDVLVEVNSKYHIIIEDKTYTGQHHDQIAKYKQALMDVGKSNIITVYNKIVEQDHLENVDINFTRKDMLAIFDKYVGDTKNNIFIDYHERLKSIDNEVESYKHIPVSQFSGLTYGGFFKHLKEENIISEKKLTGWGYVPNKSGGFFGHWWHYLSEQELTNCNVLEYGISELYLQIENNEIAVKIQNPNNEDVNAVKTALYNHIFSKEGAFYKKRHRNGKFMTVGLLAYDESNYKDKIRTMETILDEIASGNFKYQP
jgi:hypothetical protein